MALNGMKIEYIIWSMHGGGAQLSLQHLLPLLVENGHQVRVSAVFPGNKKGGERVEALGVPISYIGRNKYFGILALPI